MNPGLLAARICAGSSLIATLIIVYGAVTAGYGLGRELWLLSATGYCAVGALFIALSATPLIHLLRAAGDRLPRLPAGRAWPRPPQVAAFRRAFGITAAGFALLHGLVAVSSYLWDAWGVIVQRPFYRSGAIALLLLGLLLLTSFPRVVSMLGISHWKHLHRLAYAALLLVFHHLMLSAFAPRLPIMIAFGMLLLLSALRFLPARPGRG